MQPKISRVNGYYITTEKIKPTLLSVVLAQLLCTSSTTVVLLELQVVNYFFNPYNYSVNLPYQARCASQNCSLMYSTKPYDALRGMRQVCKSNTDICISDYRNIHAAYHEYIMKKFCVGFI